MNNMGMERGRIIPSRMRKEPENQSSGNAMAEIARKTAAGASTYRRGNEDPYDSDSDPAYHFSYFVQDRLEARLDIACAASAVEYCNPLWSPGTIPYLQDIFPPEPMFTRTGGEDVQDCYESTVQVQPSVESSSNALASYYEIMPASREKVHTCMARDPCTFPSSQSLQTVPA